ncbi:SigB/SigF/SigG family RNA polymerase sigma factor [Nocardia thailandica]|uniref:SigB/SigF/SigG family RNA polymerase sigma factor n=1 Tax=Nocardia thailandica TaxID=257275 RepID=UPI0002FFF414|nr:SigB/SigF/SigG family RNA polymerase sigma factor [Nocardia thailandica]
MPAQHTGTEQSETAIEGYERLEPAFTRLAGLRPGSREHARMRERIIEACLPLAEHIAMRYSGRGEPFEDLMQVASLGVVLAVDRYDVERGVQFLGFAVPTVMGEVRRHFRDTTWALRVTRADKELHARIAQVISELTQRLQHSPTTADIAEAAGVTVEDVVRARIAGDAYNTNSLDVPAVTGDAEQGASSAVGDKLGYADPCYDLIERAVTAAPAVAALDDDERRLLHWRFFVGLSQEEISGRLGVSQMTVSRHLKRVLDRLREQVTDPPDLAAA